MKTGDGKHRKRNWILVFSGYLLLTLMLWIPQLGSDEIHIPGGSGDSLIFYWNVWFFHEGAQFPGQSLYWTDYQFFPTGSPLSLHPFGLSELIISWPAAFFGGWTAAQNTVVFLSFVLGGFFTFLLAWKLTQSWGSSFIAGLIFSFSPYHIAHAHGNADLAAIQWIPLFFLALYWFWENPSLFRGILLSFSLTIIFYSNFYYFSISLIFGFLWAGFRFLQKKYSTRDEIQHVRRTAHQILVLKYLAASSVIFLLTVLPVLIPAVGLAGDFEQHHGDIKHSADVTSFLIPTSRSGWVKLLTGSEGYDLSQSADGRAFLGFFPLLLAIIGISYRNRRFLYWKVAGFTALILSLGPILGVFGRNTFPSHWLGPFASLGNRATHILNNLLGFGLEVTNQFLIPLPYLLLDILPILGTARAPIRFMVMTGLCLSILAAWGLKSLSDRLSPRKQMILFSISALLVLFEYVPRITFGIPRVSDFFTELQQENGDFAVLDLHSGGLMNYHQTIHKKRLVGGWIGGRRDREANSFLRKHGIMPLWRDRVKQQSLDFLESLTGEIPLRYIIVPVELSTVTQAFKDRKWDLQFADEQMAVFLNPSCCD